MTFAAMFLMVAADSASGHEFGSDGGPDQWWLDILASALSGLVHLPFAIVFVWLLHRLNLNRWLIVTTTLATIASIVLAGALDAFVWPIYSMAEALLHAIGVHRFFYLLLPNLSVCFAGALFFGWRIRRHRNDNVGEVFE